MKSEAFNIDCMIGMKEFPNNYFDLAVVDPPYGIGNTTTSAGNKKRKTLHKRVTWNNSIPSEEYFTELYRVSKNQIIWGVNHFHPFVSVPGRIVHYKMPYQNLEEGKIKFCPCDLASQSFNKRIEYFEYRWYGNHQGERVNWENNGLDARIHPTQKPIALYNWIFKKYAQERQKILDTHLGSGSSRIAAYNYKMNFTGYEIDKDYFEAAEKRFKNHVAQLKIFA